MSVPYNPSDKAQVFARYEVAIVNPELRKQINAAMKAGNYDTAIRTAAILVETKLRATCLKHGCTTAKAASGAKLADLAYEPLRGCLEPPYALATQARKGAQELLRGFFEYIRNAFGHNTTVVSTNARNVVELIALCEALLMMIRASTKR